LLILASKEDPEAMDISMADAAAVKLTLYPPSINTLSFIPGTEAPGAPPEVAAHVAVELQGPEATENLSNADPANDKNRKKKSTAVCFLKAILLVVANKTFDVSGLNCFMLLL